MSLSRIQIYLEDEQLRQLKIEAQQEHLPVSELIRRAIDQLLKTKTQQLNWSSDPLIQAVGKIQLNVTNAAKQHDRYLYGQRKKK